MKEKHWFRPRGYAHFTKKIKYQQVSSVTNYVKNAIRVAKHRFYPLVHLQLAEKKYKKIVLAGTKSTKRSMTVKRRQIFYCSHLDAQIYSYYAREVLGPRYEAKLKESPILDNAVIGYRRISVVGEDRCKSNIDFSNEIFEYIGATQGEVVVMAFDITSFFDSLDHKLLKKSWCRLLDRINLPEDHYNIYKSLIDFCYVDLHDVLKTIGLKHPKELFQRKISELCKSPTEFRELIKKRGLLKRNPFRNKKSTSSEKMGIPQGTPISAFLANLYLLEYDSEISSYVCERNGLYRRYSDDILVVCPTIYEYEIETKVMQIENIAKVEIQPTKTQKTKFCGGRLLRGEKPVQYLGFEYDGVQKRLKSSSVSKHYRNLKQTVKFRAIRAKKMKRKDDSNGFIYRKPLYLGYSHLGADPGFNRKRNYLSYVKMASKVMRSTAIRRQLSKSWTILENEIQRQTELNRLHRSAYSRNYFLAAVSSETHEIKLAIQ